MAAEWAAGDPIHLLGESYDNIRLLYVPPLLHWIMRWMDLYPELGSEANMAEVRQILGFIDRSDWDWVPVATQPKGNR